MANQGNGVRTIFLLVKVFRKKEYAEDFVRGKMFANRLSYFKGIEDDEGRADEDEGAIVVPKSEDLVFALATIEEDGKTTENTITGHDLAAPISVRPKWFEDINLFCMYAVHSGSYQGMSDGQIEGFVADDCTKLGTYAVVVKNVPAFIQRVKDAAKVQEYGILGRLVNYYDPEVGTPPVRTSIDTIFNKRKRYEDQREFRFAIDTRSTGCNPIVLEVGEIEDIALCMKTTDIRRQLSLRIKQGS